MATIIPNTHPIYLGIVSATKGIYNEVRIIDIVIAWEISEGKHIKPIFSIYDNTSSKSDSVLSLKSINGTHTLKNKDELYILIYPELIKIQTSEGTYSINTNATKNGYNDLFKWLNEE